MPIIILTEDEAVADALKDSAPEGVRVAIDHPLPQSGRRRTRSYHGITVTIHFVRDHALTIGEAVFASWLYDVIKGKTAKIFHWGECIAPEEPAIRRLVQEEFDFLKSDDAEEDRKST